MGSHTTNLSFIDFTPESYTDFNSLLYSANAWLRQNCGMRVVTCEVRNVIKGSTGVDPLKSSYSLFTSFSSNKRHFFRCLRLWLMPKGATESRDAQQIQCVIKSPNSSDDVCDNFTETIKELNESFQRSPLKGRIINVQTVSYKIGSGGLNVERMDWHITNENSYKYLNVLHVFYEPGPPILEYIGFADFTPRRLVKGMAFRGEFEDLGAVVEKASQWLKATADIHVCNVQTLNCKLKKYIGGEHSDTTRSMFTENLNKDTYYTRFVRVVYTKSAQPPSWRSSPLRVWHCNFECSEAAGQDQVLPAVNTWLRSTGCHLISAETVQQSESKDLDETYTRSSSNGRHFQFILRLFVTAP